MKYCGFDDLNAFSASLMPSAHLHIHLRNCSCQSDVSVLLVHVDGVRACQVANDDAVVLDRASASLENLKAR